VYRIDVRSDESGADRPNSCGDGIFRDTYFDATFCGNGTIRRLLTVDQPLVIDTVDDHVPELGPGDRDRQQHPGADRAARSPRRHLSRHGWENIAVHELGHSAFGLADEYEYYAWDAASIPIATTIPLASPAQPNVTIEQRPEPGEVERRWWIPRFRR
jgi:hypothetical protein